jgi:SAM-dependent methyltransferase
MQSIRRERALRDIDISALRGVEVGPLDRPLVSKNEGEIYYVDYASTAELKKSLTDPNVKLDRIVDIDFIWKDKPLADLLGRKAPVDYIIASHVVEHVPDLIGWLKEMRDALKDGGALILIVPDKRYTFDFHRRPTAFEEIELAYAERRRRPGLRCIMDHIAGVVKLDAEAIWDGRANTDEAPFHHDPSYLAIIAERYAAGHYIDIHCWVFTPWSFLDTLGRIEAKVGLGFDLKGFATTAASEIEFYVQLRRVAASSTDWRKAAAEARRRAETLDNMPALRRECTALGQEVTALRSSTSWKVTAPMRRVATLAKRLRRP